LSITIPYQYYGSVALAEAAVSLTACFSGLAPAVLKSIIPDINAAAARHATAITPALDFFDFDLLFYAFILSPSLFVFFMLSLADEDIMKMIN